ncbi:outer membrane protein assembly factor BamE domain-containing protein [Nitrospirillum iridis]|uniref:Outer membrane protein assembly factor BamE (Lipoprotein component of BamABCDE complex) n=1 Tax=Nitrospirillum iridis TaxID=765888 RepID=A0A7X0EEN4_9PROT|nr:outer membrane protein assembly factor BamE [Nitrospirillum iridis]MBB6254097.1 outer membrane protein assembly factor BamE (lipoprotein component of BamABCDE complex) [Nitrospirillum iridis]
MKRIGMISVVALTCLTACASSGHKVDQAKVDAFQAGKTTRAEVVAAIGEPTAISTLPDGRHLAVYSYATAAARPETFIPVVGAFVGGADAKGSSYTFWFDKADILTSISSTQTNTSTGLGAAAK